ncbi:MAG: glycosyltransferase family 2 protein [Planctomycetota bacterium]
MNESRTAVPPSVIAVIPALDEEGSIAAVIAGLRTAGVDRVIVADNGSRDATAAVARAAGAMVVPAARRGYGSACLAGIAAVDSLRDPPQAILFCDADGSDDLERVGELVAPVLSGRCELVIGSRAGDRSALSLPQRTGNLVAALLMRLLYRVHVSDLGPFRCIDARCLRRLQMADPAYGWTAEMQVKAYRLGLRVREVPVRALARTAGQSKISGRLKPVVLAGWAILSTVLRYHAAPLPTRR